MEGREGGFPGLVVLPNLSMSECLSSGESFLEGSKESEKGVSPFQHVHCNPPRGTKANTVLGLSNGKVCVPNEMYFDLSVINTFVIYFRTKAHGYICIFDQCPIVLVITHLRAMTSLNCCTMLNFIISEVI